MRKNLVRAAAILGVGTSALLVASLGSGCGGDDTEVSSVDGGGPDGTADTSLSDVSVQDVSTTDAGPDTAPPPFDAGAPTLATFNHQLAQIYCARLATCCVGSDTSAFNLAKCTSDAQNSNGIGLTNAVQPFVDGGHLAFDPMKAQQCFDGVNALACGVVSTATLNQIHTTCLAAVPGDVATGATGCTGSPECTPPAHCEIDAGTGTCAAARSVGASCGGLTRAENAAQCGQLITGVPAYCASTSPATFIKSGKCELQQPVDGGCNSQTECQTDLCIPTTDPAIIDAGGVGICADNVVVAAAGTCTFYHIADAGPSDAGPG